MEIAYEGWQGSRTSSLRNAGILRIFTNGRHLALVGNLVQAFFLSRTCTRTIPNDLIGERQTQIPSAKPPVAALEIIGVSAAGISSTTSKSTRSFTRASADETVCEIRNLTGVPTSIVLVGIASESLRVSKHILFLVYVMFRLCLCFI